VVLYSGGLDSLLAARILMEQDLELIGFHCILPFIAPDADPGQLISTKLARQINLKITFYRCDREYLEMISNPPHGYGKHMNPCIDCKIFFIKKAAEYMREIGADFIATGEVVGQRPMSQMKHMLNHIEKETGLSGRLLRPLSAKLLKPTEPEEKGIVDRELLYDINGRSRKRQFLLAEKFNIIEYSSPGGGCLFTDKFIARRVRDLITHHKSFDQIDIYLLTVGRHFRISVDVKIIVARNESENNELEKYMKEADYFFIPRFKGPNVYVRGEVNEGDRNFIGRVIARYGKPSANDKAIDIMNKGNPIGTLLSEGVVKDDVLKEIRI
jgi:tRNA U34 2-thiouridine synthase MnmA/TrmU